MIEPVLSVQAHPDYVRVTLSRPELRNGLDDDVIAEITSALDYAERAADCRAFVITAFGAYFCAGMRLGRTQLDWLANDMSPPRTLFTRLVDSPLATIALVDGAAIGGGVGLAAACDQVIAGPGASFRLTETLLGLVPALILPLIARRTGQHRAFSLAQTAQRLDAADAVRLGLADAQTGDPKEALRQLLIRLRSADAAASRALKRYRATLYPLDFGPPGLIGQTLRERFADPATQARITRLQAQGYLP
jgi:polyketide biosynthesis enoyl-CoA hydratase PksH